ncbi:natural killer cells antigen CD94-like [Cricetulus griseus]|uniref:Natural killer cells antigen CD94 n=1 Tax=Cricetulus griseus TaxID=10029 RepID=A0A8C2MS66_CRIGR|nr:natural killer cells antigen CD94-like [Cricetulus griseus]XP_035316240.1 natural killer cells antigen CD94-like [Cricetulus griseus]
MAVSRIALWRLMSVIFGIKCLLLMATLGFLMKNSFTIWSIQPIPSPTSIVELQEVSKCCACLEKWIGYQCHCYFISKEGKSWEESRDFCASKNSSLLQLKTKNEMSFMNSSQSHFWIGMRYNEERHAWLWEDGTAPSKDLVPVSSYIKTSGCIAYSPSLFVSTESCENENRFICKQLII